MSLLSGYTSSHPLHIEQLELTRYFYRYIIDNQEDNDMVMQYWKYFKTNKTMEDVASQVMREIDMTDNKFLAVHLRVEADWAKPPYSRGFPHPDELVKELKKHRDTGDVCIPTIYYVFFFLPFSFSPSSFSLSFCLLLFRMD